MPDDEDTELRKATLAPKPSPPVRLASVNMENVLVVTLPGQDEPLVIDFEGVLVPANHVDAVWLAAARSEFPLREVEQT